MPGTLLPDHGISAASKLSQAFKVATDASITTFGDGDSTNGYDGAGPGMTLVASPCESSLNPLLASDDLKYKLSAALQACDASERTAAQLFASVSEKNEDARSSDFALQFPKSTNGTKALERRLTQIQSGLAVVDTTIYECMRHTLGIELGKECSECERHFAFIRSRLERQGRIKPQKAVPGRSRNRTPVQIPFPCPKDLVDASSVAAVVDDLMDIAEHSEKTIILAIDLEGHDLGRNDTISVLQMYVSALDTVYLLDIFVMGAPAFFTPGIHSGKTFANILENTQFVKLLYDCRRDNDALYHLFGVSMAGVVDLQLADIATRERANERKTVNSLSHALMQRLPLSANEKEGWKMQKEWGRAEMNHGPVEAKEADEATDGVWSQDLFQMNEVNVRNAPAGATSAHKSALRHKAFVEARPLSKISRQYCIGDVVLLPAYYGHSVEHRFWNEEWADRVKEETNRRLEESKAQDFKRDAVSMTKAPAGWANIQQVDRFA